MTALETVTADTLNQLVTEAIENGDVDALRRYTGHPLFNVNAVDADGRPYLHAVIAEEKTFMMPVLLGVPGIAINISDRAGYTALAQAIIFGDFQALDLLCAAPGIDLNRASASGDLPLLIAITALYGEHDKPCETNLALVKNLLSAPGYLDVNRRARDGATALHQAIDLNACDIVALLLETPGIDPNLPNGGFEFELDAGLTPLQRAALEDDMCLFDMLMQVEQIDPAMSTSSGNLMHCAVRSGSLEMVRKRRNMPGIKVDLTDCDGYTPLWHAIDMDRPDIVGCLLPRLGAAINRTQNGRTCLELAVVKGLAMIQTLIACPQLRMINGKYGNALLLALERESENEPDMSLALLAVPGLDVNHVDKSGMAALHYAAVHTHASVLQRLCALPGLQLNLPNHQGDTALALAARHRRDAAVKTLLARPGIDIYGSEGNRLNLLTRLARICARSFTESCESAVFRLVCAGTDLRHVGHDRSRSTRETMQRELVRALGRHCLGMLMAPESFATEREMDAGARQNCPEFLALQKMATRLVSMLKLLPFATRADILAGMALVSIAEITDMPLSGFPLLNAALDSPELSHEKRERLRSIVAASMKLWDGQGVDGAGATTFSVLNSEFSRLSRLTREILQALGLK